MTNCTRLRAVSGRASELYFTNGQYFRGPATQLRGSGELDTIFERYFPHSFHGSNQGSDNCPQKHTTQLVSPPKIYRLPQFSSKSMRRPCTMSLVINFFWAPCKKNRGIGGRAPESDATGSKKFKRPLEIQRESEMDTRPRSLRRPPIFGSTQVQGAICLSMVNFLWGGLKRTNGRECFQETPMALTQMVTTGSVNN